MIQPLFYEILANYESKFARVIDLDYNLMNDDTIIDPIYGEIVLDRRILYLTSLPLVERLARIKQLALTYLVYQGANHSRLEHSLGVSHLLTKFPSDLSVDDSVTLQIVGLLHDLGHSGWGHALDGVVGRLISEVLVEGSLSEESPFFSYKKLDIAIVSYLLLHNDQLTNALNNVARSLTSDNALSYVENPSRLRDVVASVISEEENGYELFCKWIDSSPKAIEKIHYFIELLGRDINCDRVDWVVRDAHHAFHMVTAYTGSIEKVSKNRELLKTRNKRGGALVNKAEYLKNLKNATKAVREELYNKVYEGTEKSFMDSLLVRLVYSCLMVLSAYGNATASPSTKSRVMMGYIFLPDEELSHYTESILNVASQVPGIDQASLNFIRGSDELQQSIFKNMRVVMSLIRNNFRPAKAIRPYEGSNLKKIGKLRIGYREFSVSYLDIDWFMAKVLSGNGLTSKHTLPSHLTQVEAWVLMNQFLNDMRIDVISSLEVYKIEEAINQLVRDQNKANSDFRVYLLPNYYFLRSLTEDLEDPKSSIGKGDIFKDFWQMLIKKHAHRPIFFILTKGSGSEDVYAIIENEITNKFGEIIQNWSREIKNRT